MMASQHDNRVSQFPARADVAETSTSETPPTGDTSAQDRASSGQLPADSGTVKSNSHVTLIPKLSESTLQVLASISLSPQTKGKEESDRACSDSPAIATTGNSSWDPAPDRDRESSSPGHSMPVLRNRTIVPRPLAPSPALATSRNHAATTLNASIEASQEFKTLPAPAIIGLAPKPDTLPVAERPAVAESSATVPAPAPLSTLPANQSTPLKSAVRKSPMVKSSTRSRKRKRTRGSEDEIKAGDSSSDDSSEDMVPIARQTKSGRQVNRPAFFAPLPEDRPQNATPSSSPHAAGTPGSGVVKRRRKVYRKNGKDINIICKRCQRGNSPSSNMIVFCDECNVAWHQFCHNPPIGRELIDVEEAQWFCAECRPAKPVALIKLKMPRNNTPTPSHLSGPLVGGELYTTEQQRGYLSSLSHAALVDILVNLSQSNPTLPLFPENLVDLAASKFTISPLYKTMVQHEQELRPDDTPTQEVTKEREVEQIAIDSDKPKKRHGKRSRSEDSDDSGSEYEVEEHRLYPQPGNGFPLPPEEDDIDILLDDPACPTFSHTIYKYANEAMLAKGSVTIPATA